MHVALAIFALLWQTPVPAARLAQFTGIWTGTGTVLEQPSRVRMEWAPALDGSFARLTFVNEMGVPGKTRTFEGHAYYRRGEGDAYRGMWFDNSGAMRPIEATRTAEALVARWGTSQTEEGETTYRLTSPASMLVIDRVKSRDGSWKEFGRVTLARQP